MRLYGSTAELLLFSEVAGLAACLPGLQSMISGRCHDTTCRKGRAYHSEGYTAVTAAATGVLE